MLEDVLRMLQLKSDWSDFLYGTMGTKHLHLLTFPIYCVNHPPAATHARTHTEPCLPFTYR